MPTLQEQKSFIFDFMRRRPFGTLSTILSSGEPASAMIYVNTISDLSFTFGTRTNTEKYQNLLRNKHIAFAAADETTLETIQLRGTALILSNPDEVRDAMEALHSITGKESKKWIQYASKISGGILKYDVSRWIPPMGQITGGEYAFIKVFPKWLRYRRYDSDWKTGKHFTEYLIQDFS